ncbi:MAG: phosphoribosylanthranilate isomerase [Thiohalophilus sp.]|uniref:phosphoribosylanthranilate isomerase n=1 Tax=Thiohalophilus sp. TaxID=3028392 RepID=UPI002870555C|nr:phosphoribosylanthranilate isomerase [Thiohalophilus sp.]MDR9435825.1 phosphoribosylanthranilate isomerase [Thiohalophilus sp.]
MRTRVKICGITRPQDAIAAAQAGADAIGLVFYPASPRAVEIDQAREIVTALPPFVTTVGLFVDAEEATVRQVLTALPLDILQFHGDESPEACRYYARPYIKALRMREEADVLGAAREYHDAAGLLLDTYQAGVPGGTGDRFDWRRVPAHLTTPVVLAGGLTPENVAEAVITARPYGVDVSGGVESQKGIKDAYKIRSFIAEVDRVGRE